MKFLLDDRDEYPWGGALGLSHSQIHAMFKKGVLPKGQTLIAIQRRENANISWLLDGMGTPYLVDHCRDDDDCREQVRILQEEPGWSVTIAGDGTRQALILSLPCSYRHASNNRPIHYVDLHILTSAGPKAIDDAVAIAAEVRALRLKPMRFDALISGRLGAYHLLGDAAKAGLMAQTSTIDRAGVPRVAEDIAGYREERVPDLRQDERVLLGKYRRLSVSDQSRVQTIVDALAVAVRDAEASD